MEGPGMSLFQGAASIQINNSAQDRLEEQEELEDQKRRNEELKHKLANAFDDLLDDDEASSVNSSGNFTLDAGHTNGVHQRRQRHNLPPTYVESLNHIKEVHQGSETPKHNDVTPGKHGTHSEIVRRNDEPVKHTHSPCGAGDGQNHFHHEYKGHMNGLTNVDPKQDDMNNEQLKVMYEMRVKECQQLAGQIEKLDWEVKRLRERLADAVSERNALEMNTRDAHELLATNTFELGDLKRQQLVLGEQLAQCEREKQQLQLELQSAEAALLATNQRAHKQQMMNMQELDAVFKQQQERHWGELQMLQEELKKTKDNLEMKDNEVKKLDKLRKAKEREHEDTLIEKGATINRLAAELEAAQSRLAAGDAARLREKLGHTAAERNAAREQVKELGSKLETTARELAACRSRAAAKQQEHEARSTALLQALRDALPDTAPDPPSPTKLNNMHELLKYYKQQLEKIPALQEEIDKRDRELSSLRAESPRRERAAAAEAELRQSQREAAKEEVDALRAELEAAQARVSALEARPAAEASEAARHAEALNDAVNEIRDLNMLYMQACSSRDAITKELKELQARFQNEKATFAASLNKERLQTQQLTAELNITKEKLNSATAKILQLQKEFTDKQMEYTMKLNKCLAGEKTPQGEEPSAAPCAQCGQHVELISQLQDQLAKCSIKLLTLESNEALMNELRSKAEYFERYIQDRFEQLNSQRSVGTNTETPATPEPDPIPERPPDAPGDPETPTETSDAVQPADDRIAFSKEDLLSRENKIRVYFADKLVSSMKTAEAEWEKRIQETETLLMGKINYYKKWVEKKFHEIEKLKTVMTNERELFEEYRQAKEESLQELVAQRDALQADKAKLKELSRAQLKKLEALEEAMRNYKENASTELKKAIEAKLMMRIKHHHAEKTYQELQEKNNVLQEKYKKYKKYISSVKEYTARKDAHLSGELSRIQGEYWRIVRRLQEQLAAANAGKHRETEPFADKINELNKEFEKLSQSLLTDAIQLEPPQ